MVQRIFRLKRSCRAVMLYKEELVARACHPSRIWQIQ
jgi:hypothetical protein